MLAAQRDRYLPLRVIREQLEALERGERVVGVVAPPPSFLSRARRIRESPRPPAECTRPADPR